MTKRLKLFSLHKVLLHISVPFSLSQMTLDLHIRNRMKLSSKFCFLKNETFLAKRVPALSYMVFLICGMLQ